MTPEEVIGHFVSFECMIEGSRKINELDDPSTSEAQPVAFKATEDKKEESTPSRQPIDADRKSTRLNSSHITRSRMPSSA